MEHWLSTPAIVLATLAIIGAAVQAGKWIGNVNADRKSFRDFMQEIRDDIKAILQRLPAATITRSSPIRLTDLGREISKTIQAKKWAATVSEALANEAAGKSAYEIQALAKKHCENDLQMTPEETSLCQTAAFDYGVTLEQVKGVLGIEVRDILLTKAGLAAPD